MPGDMEIYDAAGAGLGSLPRFIEREAESGTWVSPPPLPALPLLRRILNGFAAVAAERVSWRLAVRVIALAVSCGGAAFAMMQLPDAGPPPALKAEPVRAVDPLSQALATVAALEARLEFAAGYARHRDDAARSATLAEVPAAEPTSAPPIVEEGDAALDQIFAGVGPAPELEPGLDGADHVALYVVRDLPPHAALSAGVPAGEGVWAVAAGDVSDFETLLAGDGPDVAASRVEAISQAGVLLDVTTIELRKPQSSGRVAALTAAPESEPAPAAKWQKAKKKSYGQSRKRAGYADLTPRKLKRRVRGDDAYRARVKQRAYEAPVQEAAAEAGADDKDSPGVFTKFFTWLKGDPSKTANEEPPSPAPSEGPADEHAATTFGMFPKD